MALESTGPAAESPEEVAPPQEGRDPGALNYVLPESICGDDERTKVANTTVSPYFWVCRLSMKFGGDHFVGSGWLANTGSENYDVVVTSGHCVFDTGTQFNPGTGFAESVTVVPGATRTTQPYGSYTVGSDALRASDKWQAGGSDKASFDYGAILTPKTGRLGGVGMWVISDDDLHKRTIMNTGYPGDKPHGQPYGDQWEHSGPVSAFSPTMLRYMNDTMGGQSGSPTYALRPGGSREGWDGKDPYIWSIGIHGYGGCPNQAVRMTDSVANDIINWGND